MSRKVMRVALDFNCPIGETWSGYLNPHYDRVHTCPTCRGSGSPKECTRFLDEWYGQKVDFDPVAYGSQLITVDNPALVESISRKIDRSIALSKAGKNIGVPGRWDSTDEYYTRNGIISRERAIQIECRRMLEHYNNQWSHHLIQVDVDALIESRELTPYFPEGHIPTISDVQAFMMTSMMIGGSFQWVCVKARCKREGVATHCPKCQGSGDEWESPEAEKAAEDWVPIEPPVGPGWQLWQTVSEGGPVTPVFSTPEALAAYCSGSERQFTNLSPEDWLKFISEVGETSCSAAVVNGEWKNGVELAVHDK